MTPHEENEYRRRRLRIAEAEIGLRCSRTVRNPRGFTTITGRDEAEVEQLRKYVHELRMAGHLGKRRSDIFPGPIVVTNGSCRSVIRGRTPAETAELRSLVSRLHEAGRLCRCRRATSA